ncbi:MAG: ion channel [Rhodopila sp.]|nr:ion channel [Rhodopila sp.]
MPHKNHHHGKPIPVGRAEFGVSEFGVSRFEFHDPYYLAVSLSWPGFAVAMLACWLAINLGFALLYALSPGDVTNLAPGSFADAFFFSIETMTTVGYGVMAPATTYAHIVSAAEIVTGMAFTAIVTGLLFVRFSRPNAKLIYADDVVVAMRHGQPTLMLRVASGRMTITSSATARLLVRLVERKSDGVFVRSIHELRLQEAHMPLFVMPWTLMHVIDETSPLYGHNAETLARGNGHLFVTIEARDHALAAQVWDIKNYQAHHIRFGMRFANAVTLDETGHATIDLARIGLLEPDSDVMPGV